MGNTLAIGAAREFVYSDAGRMSALKQDGVVTREYAYNGRGEQVRGHLGASNSYTLYDGAGHWLGDYDNAGVPIQQAIWMDDMPVGLLANGSQLHYVQPDHLGTPRVVIEPVRDVAVWKWDLRGEAFGNTPPEQDADGDGVLSTLDLRYPGQRHNQMMGLNYNYFRNYDATSGRYSQSDLIGLGAGPSTYAYGNGNPLSFVDELGLQATTVDKYCLQYPLWCVGGVGGAAVVASPKPQSLTTSSAKHTDTRECDYGTCGTKYPEYDLCLQVSRSYPYAMQKHALLDFPAGSKARTSTPATGGICSVKGVHQTVFLNGMYVGSLFSCNCCTNSAGGPVLSEVWGNNRGR